MFAAAGHDITVLPAASNLASNGRDAFIKIGSQRRASF
jgi:hypothetical protein